jgi:hypothetical protein
MATVASRSNLVGLSVTKLITLAVLRKKANMLRAERDRAVRPPRTLGHTGSSCLALTIDRADGHIRVRGIRGSRSLRIIVPSCFFGDSNCFSEQFGRPPTDDPTIARAQGVALRAS